MSRSNGFEIQEHGNHPGTGRPWHGTERMPVASGDLRIALISSTRAGLDPLSGLDHAIAVSNELRPDFAIQMGDAIPGYVDDLPQIHQMWDELDAITAKSTAPLFRLAGNHDISNAAMRDVWVERYGPSAYSFVVGDALFVVLDSEDGAPFATGDYFETVRAISGDASPPVRDFVDRYQRGEVSSSDISDLRRESPAAYEELISLFSSAKAARCDAAISEEQLDFALAVLRDNPRPRWTFLLMHTPAWTGEGHPALRAILREAGDRPLTGFSGHVTHYRSAVFEGRKFHSLGYTDPAVARPRFGADVRRDQLTWLRLTDNGPKLTNVLLDDLLDAAQQPWSAAAD